MISAEHISYKFLHSKEISHGVKQGAEAKIVRLDDEDKSILRIISQDARMNIVDIAKNGRLATHVVNYRLKNLIRSKIIEGFKPRLDIAKLGYQWYLLLIQLENLSRERKKEFLNFCKMHKKVYYVTSTIGAYNTMIDIHVKDIEEFKEVLLDIKEKFSDIVKLYESVTVFEEHKTEYLSESLI